MKTALLTLFFLALFASFHLPAGDRETLTVATKGLKPSDWSSDEGLAGIVEEPVGALTRIQLMSDKNPDSAPDNLQIPIASPKLLPPLVWLVCKQVLK